MPEQVFAGLKILDLTRYIAGPYCTKIFADFGADVIKVEEPDQGDPARMMEPFLDDDPHPDKSLIFSHLNFNKKSVILDLKNKQCLAAVKELARDADVLVESFSPGVMERLGLGYAALRDINPSLVLTSISNFGQTGPYRDFKMSELTLNGFHAMIHNGEPDRFPLKKGGNTCLYQGGLMAALATMGALHHACETGVGQHVDVSLMEVQAGCADRKSLDLLSWAFSGGTYYDYREAGSDHAIANVLPWGIFPCKDGFLMSQPILPHWPRFVELMEKPELLEQYTYPDDLYDPDLGGEFDALWYVWLADMTKKEAMEKCQKAKWFATAIQTPGDVVSDPHFKERGFWVEVEHPITGKRLYPGAPIKFGDSWQARSPAPLLGQHTDEVLDTLKTEKRSGKSPSQRRNKSSKNKFPLEGVRVIDLCVAWAGPFAAWHLACLGAEVIHVDSIQNQPDMTRWFSLWPTEEALEGRDGTTFPNRQPGERPWNTKSLFARFAWNKLSCCINLKDEKGKEVFKDLIRASDIFLENNSARVMDNLGLGPEELLKVNPGLICINMPSFGRTGSYKDYVGWGANAEALTGHYWVRGYADDEHPIHNTSTYHMDATGGTMAAFAAMAGLRQREKTGQGLAIDFGQIESVIPHMGEIYMDYAWNGRDQKTPGNRHSSAVQGCYQCRGEDAWVNITLNDDGDWRALGQALGDPAWIHEPRFSTNDQRREHHDEIDRLIETWTVTQDKYEAFHVLQKFGVPAGPVLADRDFLSDPQLNTRGFFEIISHKEIGTYRYPGAMWKMSETPVTVRNPPPMMGEHNEYVFREVLKMNDEEIRELTDKQVIGGDRYTWA